MARVTEEPLALALRRRSRRVVGELAYWRWRAGFLAKVPVGAVEPYAAQIAGHWSRAAELWTALGCPYEAAWALAECDDEYALRRAFDAFERLGAKPASAIVATRLGLR